MKKKIDSFFTDTNQSKCKSLFQIYSHFINTIFDFCHGYYMVKINTICQWPAFETYGLTKSLYNKTLRPPHFCHRIILSYQVPC